MPRKCCLWYVEKSLSCTGFVRARAILVLCMFKGASKMKISQLSKAQQNSVLIVLVWNAWYSLGMLFPVFFYEIISKSCNLNLMFSPWEQLSIQLEIICQINVTFPGINALIIKNGPHADISIYHSKPKGNAIKSHAMWTKMVQFRSRP